MKDINATVIVDLAPSEEEILKNLQKDARWGINRARKEGLIVEQTNKESYWGEFYEIYKETIKEGGAKIESLEHLKEHSNIFFVCKKENKIIAGATLEIVNNVPILSRNASLKEYQAMQPNNLLYWECIKWSKKNRYKMLDLGGWQINAEGHLIGVNKFKERWGKIEYYYKDYPVHTAIGRKLVRNLKFFKWVNRKLKREGKND